MTYALSKSSLNVYGRIGGWSSPMAALVSPSTVEDLDDT